MKLWLHKLPLWPWYIEWRFTYRLTPQLSCMHLYIHTAQPCPLLPPHSLPTGFDWQHWEPMAPAALTQYCEERKGEKCYCTREECWFKIVCMEVRVDTKIGTFFYTNAGKWVLEMEHYLVTDYLFLHLSFVCYTPLHHLKKQTARQDALKQLHSIHIHCTCPSPPFP